MTDVPGINPFGGGLFGASAEQRIVNRTPGDADHRGGPDGRIVFLGSQRHDLEAIADFIENHERLVAAHAIFSRESGRDGVKLSETVCGTTAFAPFGVQKYAQARSVVYVTREETWKKR